MTDKPKSIEINCATGEVTERFLTEEEIVEFKIASDKEAEEQAAREAEAQAKADAKASAIAKLIALGLTEEEAQAFIS